MNRAQAIEKIKKEYLENYKKIFLKEEEISFFKKMKNEAERFKLILYVEFFQGCINLLNKEYNEAIDYFKKAMKLDDKFAFPWNGLGNVYSDLKEYEKAIMSLPLLSKSLHDRIGEMLELIGSWLDYNTQTRHKITPDHAYELDVAWLRGKNPEIAIEVQISGNLSI